MQHKQWPKLAVDRFLRSLAPATWSSYNKQFKKFVEFADVKGVDVVNKPQRIPQGVVVEFLVDRCDSSARPKSVINTSVAVLQNFCKATGVPSVVDTDIVKLVEGLVKSGTTEPMRRTKVLPVKPFMELFRKWGDNGDLSIWALRLKTLTLLSLTVMLRPSDIAPKSEVWKEGIWSAGKFKRSWVDFTCDQYVQIYMMGNKNDYSRDGFCVNLPYSSDKVTCPVVALKEYMFRTQRYVKQNGPVFVTVNRPYTAMTASGISGVLNKAIELVGLDKQGYSAKCFRPTGATVGVESGLDPNVVQALGRWKSTETFQKHYVHAKPPIKYTDTILVADFDS